jgi:hypothetical protein
MAETTNETTTHASLEDEIKQLKVENRRLAGEVADLTETLKETRHEARDRRLEAKQLKEQVDALTAERDDFRTRAEAEPSELQARLDTAHATIRELKHSTAFSAVAKGLKVSDPARLADLIALAKYTPEGDEPDHDKITEAFGAALKGRPYLLDPAETATTTPNPNASREANGVTREQGRQTPAPGSSRGMSITEATAVPRHKIPGRL